MDFETLLNMFSDNRSKIKMFKKNGEFTMQGEKYIDRLENILNCMQSIGFSLDRDQIDKQIEDILK
jgi:hypothetical protein